MIYRKVLTEERWPDKDDRYITDCGLQYYSADSKYWEIDIPEFWLEEIPVPTDEEIEKIKESSLDYLGDEYYMAGMESGFDTGFNAALKYMECK